MTFQMTNLIEGEYFVGIARYPIDQVIASGEPRITSTGWVKLCIKVATKDTVNLNNILKVGEKLLSKISNRLGRPSCSECWLSANGT